MTNVFYFAGNVNGGGCCKPGTCDGNIQAEYLPVSSVVSPELCKDMCCNTSLCQMSIVRGYGDNKNCQIFKSHGCKAITMVSEVHFCDKGKYYFSDCRWSRGDTSNWYKTLSKPTMSRRILSGDIHYIF